MTASAATRNTGQAFAVGVLIMLIVNVLQRSVGLLRGIGFARYLSAEELGHWALANSFFVLAVPILALGFPGSFGKFAEHYRKRGQFANYFRLCLKVTAIGAAAGIALLLLFSEPFSLIVFGQTKGSLIVLWWALCLLSVVGFSFVTELASGLRQITTLSWMQFTQSVVFAGVGVGLAFRYQSWWVLLPSFAIANIVAMTMGWLRLRDSNGDEFLSPSNPDLTQQLLWRLAPFAVSLWLLNLFSNMFEVSDRYMLLHLVGDQGLAQGLIGQYHCARIVPNLLISVGIMLGGVMLPYLSQDWEEKQIERLQKRVRQTMKTVAIGFLAISTAAMLVAPVLFRLLIDNHYDQAEAVLPLVLAQAVWIALFCVAEPFLLCIEKGKQLIALLAVSLVCNLGLNWIMIPAYGLEGAIVATAISNFLALSLLLWQIRRTGCRLGKGTYLLCLSPCILLFGAIPSLAVFTLIVFLCGRTELLFSASDREQIDSVVCARLQRYGIPLETLWPK
ncbi:MAG: lipopolysaccharide biosynthesis protein [Planctomycetota bacterium]